MCGCKQGTCPGNCPCGCRHTPPDTMTAEADAPTPTSTERDAALSSLLLTVHTVRPAATARADLDEELRQWLAAHDADLVQRTRQASFDAVERFLRERLPKVKGNDWPEEFASGFEAGALAAASIAREGGAR